MRCGTPGTSGHATTKSSIHHGAYFINPASMHRRYDSLPREICEVSPYGTEGGGILPDRLAEVSRRHSTTRNGGKARTVERSRRHRWSGPMASGEALAVRFDAWDERTTGTLGADAPVGVSVSPQLNLPNRRIRDPYVRWCGRGEAVRSLPIPIRARDENHAMTRVPRFNFDRRRLRCVSDGR